MRDIFLSPDSFMITNMVSMVGPFLDTLQHGMQSGSPHSMLQPSFARGTGHKNTAVFQQSQIFPKTSAVFQALNSLELLKNVA